MSKTPYQVQDLAATDQLLTPYVILPYRTATTTVGAPATGVFHSTIIGRGKMVDLSNDLSVRMGIERICIQQIMRVDGEIGTNGQTVYKPVNDKYDQIRFAGAWGSYGTATLDGNGSYLYATPASTNNFVEVSFYGTGLNMLTGIDGSARVYGLSVDGGSSSVVTVAAGIQYGRGYANNIPFNLVTGLSLGLHTVKLAWASGGLTWLNGFEILNVASTLSIAAGTAFVNGAVASQSVASTSAYNSGFESGTLGTRGGRVLVYMKSDGTIGKAVTPTDAASLTLTSTSHANEEVIRSYFSREFGAGRADDWSTLGSYSSPGNTGSKAFTLDDGTTTFISSGATYFNYGVEGVYPTTTNDFLSLTFVGTGLDIVNTANIALTGVYSIFIDGVSIATGLTGSTFGTSGRSTYKIASGLPYGSHTVKILQTTSATNLVISNFVVYGPKKPTLPTGAIELADYNIVADFVASSVTPSGNASNTSQGVLTKASVREIVYVGTWGGFGTDTRWITGNGNATSTGGSYAEYTFFGTGVAWRTHFSAGTYNVTISIDGNANLSSYTTSINSGGSTILTAATGLVSGTGNGTSFGAGIYISNIPLGLHKIRITYNSSANMLLDCFEVITPIHTHKNNGPFIQQNTLSIGSQGINDGRKFGGQLSKYLHTAVWQSTNYADTTSGNAGQQPTPYSVGFYVDRDCTIQMVGSMALNNSQVPGNHCRWFFHIDGTPATSSQGGGLHTLGNSITLSTSAQASVRVNKGWHYACVFVNHSNGLLTMVPGFSLGFTIQQIPDQP